jgi:hypothetical protein
LKKRLDSGIKTFKARGIPLVIGGQSSNLPAVSMSIPDEDVVLFDQTYTKRTAPLYVEGHLFKSLNDDGDLLIEDITNFSNTVENILLDDLTLGNTSESIALKRVEYGLDEDATDLITFQHTYEIIYYRAVKLVPKEKIPTKLFANGERIGK